MLTDDLQAFYGIGSFLVALKSYAAALTVSFSIGAPTKYPVGPRAVVIPHIPPAKQVFESKPGMRTSLSDATVGDDFAASLNLFPS